MGNGVGGEAAWKQALELFDELMSVDLSVRTVRLQEIEKENAELAAHVKQMFAADGGAGSLDALERAGAFELKKLLGRGGMGEVHLAERTLGDATQRVALKVLKRGMDSAGVMQRFARERRILARLDHPNIARLIDGGITADGRPYYVMDLVEGSVITEAARSMNVRERVRLVIKVCEAVAFAHARLVVHRDLKPSNILVDARGEPRVLDFGIAKLLDGSDETQTNTGERVMSPAYAAPEQILGEPIGVAADIYALGVLLYELLTGALPHPRNAGSLEGLVRGLAAEEAPVAPSKRASGDGDLDLIVLQALKREPERRYATVQALAGDLQRWLELRPVSARPDTLGYRLGRFVRRNRVGVAAASISTLAVGTGIVLALWQAEVARSEARRAEAEAEHATHLLAFMQSVFSEANPLARAGTTPPTVVEVLKTAAKRVDELADRPQLQLAVLRSLGKLALGNEDKVTGAIYVERAFSLASSLPNTPPVVLASAHQAMAELRVAQERHQDSVDAAQRGLALLGALGTQAAKSELAVAAELYEVLVDSFHYLSRTDEALAANTEAIRMSKLVEGPGAIVVGKHLYSRGIIEHRLKRFEDAERSIDEALVIHRRLVAPTDPRMAPLLAIAAKLKTERERHDEAEQLSVEALQVARANAEEHGTFLVQTLIHAGDALKLRGRFEEAKAHFEEASELAQKDTRNRLQDGLAQRSLGDLLRYRGAHTEAAEKYAQAAQAFAEAVGPTNLLALTGRAEVLFSRGLAGEVQASYAALTELEVEIAAKSSPTSKDVGVMRYDRGVLQAKLGDREAAIRLLREAIAIWEPIFGQRHLVVQRARIALGVELMERGDPSAPELIAGAASVLKERGLAWDPSARLAEAALAQPAARSIESAVLPPNAR